VLNLFGRDIAENFVCLLTFSDGSNPSIIEALTASESPFNVVKNQIQGDWHLEFNNSAIYTKLSIDNKKNQFTRTLWDISMSSFEKFFDKLMLLSQKSLTQTKETLKLR